jgi:hypothetical protein
MSGETVAIVLATFLGPIFAVAVTLWREQRKENHSRRFYIFRTLMATRRLNISREHVDALNMIEVDFYGVTKVQAAYRAYLAHLNHTGPADQQWGDRRLDLAAQLLHELSVAMKMPIGKIDLRSGGYSPLGWGGRDTIERYLLDVAGGKESVPIRVTSLPPQPPSPPTAINPPPAPASPGPGRAGFFSQPKGT